MSRNSTPARVIAPNLRVRVPPKGEYKWIARGEAPAGANPFKLHTRFDSDGNLFLTIVREIREGQEAGGTAVEGRILCSRKLELQKLEITRIVAGVTGKVLPRGRLPALMSHVGKPEQMYDLCWGVLRRYSTAKGWGAKPSRPQRNQVYHVISRAWQRVPRWLRNLPPGFWNDDIPLDDEVLWPTTAKRSLHMGNKVLVTYIGQSLDKLLDRDCKL